MKNNTENKPTSKGPGTNPNVNSESGGINPSAPTTGTEGWGTTSDERRVLSTNDPGATRAGQMKGNPGDHQTAATERAGGGAASTHFRKQHPGDNQADMSRRSGASSHSMSTSHGGQDRTFRCADAGNADCRWETSGNSDEEILQRAEEHGRKDHGMADWTAAMRNKVRDSIRHRNAA